MEFLNTDFLNARASLDRAATIMKLDPNALEPLRSPKRSLTVTIPVRMDDGSIKIFPGYRVHHDLALGPCKGGLRIHPFVTLGEVAAMAMLTTWKCSLMNLPFGGAHGGIRLDPKTTSKQELERATRRYTSEIIDMIGPDSDIAGPDLNTDEQTMAWVMDTYSVNLGHTVPSIATGKPSSIGGSLGLLDATGYGVAFATRKVVNHLDLKKNNPKIIIQGFGHVGSVAAASLAKDGCTIIGLSDASGGVFNKKGIDIDKVKEFMSQGKRLSECPVGEVIPNKELLEQNCDILIPCAVRGQINEGNAANLKCKLIIEGANAPTTPEADKILDDRGIPVLPDIVANAAGVTVSYFEWVQGLMRLFWSEHEVLARLDQLIGTALDRVIFTADQTKRSYRMSAMTLALGRLVEARKLRGLYP